MDLASLDRLRSRRLSRGLTIGRSSYRARVARFRTKRWQVAQCAVAAAVAWLVAKHALGHEVPVFAPIAAVLALGTSYGQRLRRVAEITVGVAVGVLLADLLVALLGTGAWQLGLVVAMAMTAGILLDGGTMLVNQAAIQSIFVVALLPGTGGAFTRWTDALVGGLVALVAATIVPAAALRRPREQASVVLRKQARLLRGVAEVLREGDADQGEATPGTTRASCVRHTGKAKAPSARSGPRPVTGNAQPLTLLRAATASSNSATRLAMTSATGRTSFIRPTIWPTGIEITSGSFEATIRLCASATRRFCSGIGSGCGAPSSAQASVHLVLSRRAGLPV